MDLSLHEINIPRNWPTEVGTDVPIRHVWHSCRTDLKDLMCKYRGIEDIDREKDHTLWLKRIAAAVALVSRTPCPFFHVSKTSDGAYYFAERGQRFRGEHPCDQIFTRIDLLAMYQAGIIGPESLIDISTHDAVRTLFRPLLEDLHNLSTEEQDHLHKALLRGPRDHKMLLCWRGCVDPHYIIIVAKPPRPPDHRRGSPVDLPLYLDSGGPPINGHHSCCLKFDDEVSKPHSIHNVEGQVDVFRNVEKAVSRKVREIDKSEGGSNYVWAKQMWTCIVRRLLGVKPPARRSGMRLRKLSEWSLR